jgi:hypothetical protein
LGFRDRAPECDRELVPGQAIEYAIELVARVTSYNGETRDTETTLYRYSFDVDWIVQR